MRYLIWFVLCFVVVTWIKRLLMRLTNPDAGSSGASRGNAHEVESMRQCVHCGIHIPASEALIDGKGLVFCSSEHQTAHSGR
jgi:uncharacterized protein